MTEEKKKAVELVDRFAWESNENNTLPLCNEVAKQCALICVDEIEKASHKLISKDLSNLWFWQNVEKEIEKL